MDYENFWKSKGLDFITPKHLENPEGFDVKSVLAELTGGQQVLEIGCGIGRIAKFFNEFKYTGVDINPDAIRIAQEALPNHRFGVVGLNDELPKRNTVLLYTVLLHIPDEAIQLQLERFCAAAEGCVIIAEIMDRKERLKRRPNTEYDISNQRDPSDYEGLMEDNGFVLGVQKTLEYAYYGDKKITFMKFFRKP